MRRTLRTAVPRDAPQRRTRPAAGGGARGGAAVRHDRHQPGAIARHDHPRRAGGHLRGLRHRAPRRAQVRRQRRPGPAAPLVRAVRNRHRVRHQPGAQPGRRPGDVVVRGRSVHGAGAGVRAQPRQGGELQVHAHDRGLPAAAVAAGSGPRPGDLRQPHLAAYRQLLLPTGRDRQDRDRAVPGGLPRAEPRDAVGVHLARGPVQASRHPNVAAAAADVGHRAGHRRVREGSGQRARVLLRVPGHAVRGYGKEVLPGHRFGSHRHRRHRRVHGLRPRAGAREHLARPLRRCAEHGLPADAGHLLHRRRRLVRRRHRARPGRTDPRR